MIDLSQVEMKGKFAPDDDTLEKIREVTREQLINEITPDNFGSEELATVLSKFELNRLYNVLLSTLAEWFRIHDIGDADFSDEVRKYKKMALAYQIFKDI